MKLGTEDKKKLAIAGVAGLIALGAVGYSLSFFFGGPPPPPPTAPTIIDNTKASGVSTPAGAPAKIAAVPPGNVVAGAAEKIGSTSGALDPTLHEEAMLNTESLVYSGTGRNIFAGTADATVAIAKPVAPPRPIPPPPQTTQPTRVVDQGPPPPPPIDLKFFGTSTSATGVRRAFLLKGDEVFLAQAGDIVQRRYRVVSISPSSILVEDIPNINKQTLPLNPN